MLNKKKKILKPQKVISIGCYSDKELILKEFQHLKPIGILKIKLNLDALKQIIMFVILRIIKLHFH